MSRKAKKIAKFCLHSSFKQCRLSFKLTKKFDSLKLRQIRILKIVKKKKIVKLNVNKLLRIVFAVYLLTVSNEVSQKLLMS